MNWPTSQDYNEAVQNAASSFSDSGLKSGEATVNAIGLPVPRSGNFADVYQFKGGDGKMWAVKCFTRKVAGLQERYAKIDEHLRKAKLPFTVGFKYFEEGIRVRGQWFPLLKMEWVEGFTLNEFVRNNAGTPKYLHALMQMWAKLTMRLRDANFAHADLQHGNVLLVPGDSQSKLGLKLIDYDGMWVPALADMHSGEIGHPNFQHPLRLKDRLYNGEVDRFPHLVIATALRATLIGGKTLWDKFDNGDNLLFKEGDLRDPANAKVFKELWNLRDDVLCTLIGKLALAAREPLRKTPWLDDLLLSDEGQRLSEDEEKKVLQLLDVAPHFTAIKAVAVAPAVHEFSDFAFDEDTSEKPVPRPKAAKSNKQPKFEEEKEKSKLALFIGGGVLVLALIGGIAAMTLGGKKKPTGAEVAKVENKGDSSSSVLAPPKKEIGGEPKIVVVPPKLDPPEEKKDPTPEEKKDPTPEVKQDVKEPRQPTINFKSPVTGVFAVPHSKDILFLAKDNPLLQRFEPDQKKMSTVGRHTGPLRAVACTSDGSKAISGGDDNLLRVWSLNDSRELHALKEHAQPIVACAVSPDNERAVSLGQDQVLCEWDIKEGKLLRKFPIPASLAVAYLPDGKSVLMGTANESAGIFDLEKQERVKQLPGHQGNVNAVCISKNGKYGFTAGDDSIIRVWNLATGEQKSTLEKHKGAVVGLTAHPDGRVIASAGVDNQVYMWNSNIGTLAGTYTSPWPLRSVVIADSGDQMILGTGLDGSTGSARFLHLEVNGPAVVKKPIDDAGPAGIKEIWKVNAPPGKLSFTEDGGKIVATFGNNVFAYAVNNGASSPPEKVSDDSIRGCELHPDGSYLVNQTPFKGPQQLFCWDPQTKSRRFTIEDDEAKFSHIAVASKANTVLLLQKQFAYGVYSLTDGKKLATVALPGAGTLFSVSCTDDGEAVLGFAAGSTMYFRAKKDMPFKNLSRLEFGSGTIPSVRLSPDAKSYCQFSNAKDQTSIRVYDTSTGNKRVELAGHTGPIRYAVFHPDNRRLLSIGDATLRVWDIWTGKELQQVALLGTTHGLAVSPDGLLTATISGNPSTLQLWRLQSDAATAVATVPKPLTSIVPYAAPPQFKEVRRIDHLVAGRGLAFSSDGSRLFAGAQTGLTVPVYNTKDGTRLDAIPVSSRPAFVGLSPDDSSVIAGSGSDFLSYDVVKKTRGSRFDATNVDGSMRASIIAKDHAMLLPDGRGSLGVYSLADGKALGSFPIHPTDPIKDVSCSKDGADIMVLTAPGDVYAKLNGQKEFRKLGNYPKALAAEISADGKQFLVTYDASPRIYETGDGQEVVAFEGKTGFNRFAGYLKDNRYAASVHANGFLRLWDCQTGKQIQQIGLPSLGTTYVALSADGRLAATWSNAPDVIHIWRIDDSGGTPAVDPKTPKEGQVATSADLSSRIVDCFYSSDGTKIYAAADNGAVHVLDPLTLEEIQKYSIVDGKCLHVLAVPKSTAPMANLSKEWIYLLDAKKHVHVFDVEKGTVTKDISLETRLNDPNTTLNYHLTITPNGQTLFVLGRTGGWTGARWDLKGNTDAIFAPLERPPFKGANNTHVITFSADGRFGAATSSLKLLLWNAKTGADIGSFDCRFAHYLTIVPEATVVVATGSERNIPWLAAWNFTTGKQVWNDPSILFGGGLQAIPKSKRVAYSTPTELVIRDCVTGEDTLRWKTTEAVVQIAASSDGKFLATFGASSKKVTLWAVPAVAAKK